MASEERPGTAVAHEEHEWEAQKKNFHSVYIVEDMTLKKATTCMIERHGFRASHRQWERKAKLWGFLKYVPEDTRRQQQEASQPGQARDRNYRRWELRTNRRRSRSVSSVRSDHSASDDLPARPRASSAIGPFLTLTTSNEDFGQTGNSRNNSDANGFLHPDPSELASFSDDTASPQFDDSNSMYSTYDVGVPQNSQAALRSPVPPDHFSLEATLHKPTDVNSPVQLKIPYGQRADLNTALAEPEVPEIFVSMDGDLSSPLRMDHSSQSTHNFPISSHQAATSQSGMSGVIPYFQQRSDAFEVASGLPHDGSQSAYGSQYDPAIHSPWRDGIPDEDLAQSQSYQMEGYDGNNSSMQPMDPTKDISNEFINFDAFAKDPSPEPIPMDQPYMSQSADVVNLPGQSQLKDVVSDGRHDDPHRLETDFCQKVEDYTETVLDTVKSITMGNLRPFEQQKLENELNSQGLVFSGEMRVRLDNLVTSLKRSQKDIDYTQKIRNQNTELKKVVNLQGSAINIYRQFMIEKGFNPDLELGFQGEFQGPPSMKPEIFEDI